MAQHTKIWILPANMYTNQITSSFSWPFKFLGSFASTVVPRNLYNAKQARRHIYRSESINNSLDEPASCVMRALGARFKGRNLDAIPAEAKF